MKTNLRSLTAFVVSGVLASVFTNSAPAFSREGHESIAQLAFSSKDLSPKAKAAITRILGTETIAFAAEWPDAIKPPFGALHSTQIAKDFLRAHPDAHRWHFTNFPIGSALYSPSSPYAKPDDISHAVKGCIAILEGKGTWDGLTQKEALRYLIHLVGDAHQPLHTTFEQFDVSNHNHPVLLPTTPVTPAGAFTDGGGNALFYDQNKELHADWDDLLVAGIVKSEDSAKLVQTLQPEVSKNFDKATGNYHDWIDVWLSESMKVVPPAYAGITYNQVIETTNAEGRVSRTILISLPEGYAATQTKVVRTQVIRGGAHLLQLLNAIKWAP